MNDEKFEKQQEKNKLKRIKKHKELTKNIKHHWCTMCIGDATLSV